MSTRSLLPPNRMAVEYSTLKTITTVARAIRISKPLCKPFHNPLIYMSLSLSGAPAPHALGSVTVFDCSWRAPMGFANTARIRVGHPRPPLPRHVCTNLSVPQIGVVQLDDSTRSLPNATPRLAPPIPPARTTALGHVTLRRAKPDLRCYVQTPDVKSDRRPRCVTITVQTDQSNLGRYRAEPPRSIVRMDDRVLIETLASINRPAGLIRFGDRLRLSAPVTDADLGIRQ